MVDFFKDLSFIILPLGLGSKRLDFFVNQIKKYAGKVKDESTPTHVIIDDVVVESKEKCLTALRTFGINLNNEVIFVGTKWLSKCFEEKKLVDTQPFEFSWTKVGVKCYNRKTVNCEITESCTRPTEVSAEYDVESPDRKKRNIEMQKYICSQSSTSNRVVSPKNKLVTDELQKLADAFAARNDSWRAYSYRNAVSAIQRFDRDITTFQEALEIPGVGEKMALKIMEILESGNLRKVGIILDDKTKTLERFCSIWGVGPSTAESWYTKGYRTLDDLKKNAPLTKQQEIGLKYYDDFLQRIPREEVEQIASIVDHEMKNVYGCCKSLLVGSYRRGKVNCGDIDILLINPGPKSSHDILLHLTDILKKKNYLTDDLVTLEGPESTHRKYMGVFRVSRKTGNELYRRIDVFVIPESEYAAGLMHYTGSAAFNRSIRLLAARKGLTLTEHGLFSGIIRKGAEVLNEGELIPTSNEEAIFNYLGLEYKSPEERDH